MDFRFEFQFIFSRYYHKKSFMFFNQAFVSKSVLLGYCMLLHVCYIIGVV